VPEALADRFIQIENRPEAKLPADLLEYQQVILEKQTLDIFQSLHANELVERIGARPEFVVFGVVTEYCVGLAVKGLLQRKRRVTVVQDAIETLSAEAGKKCEAEFQRLGARATTTREALNAVANGTANP
jgi:nicotinamidase-related amidase